jgi:Icc-related predicted phosphoesterase
MGKHNGQVSNPATGGGSGNRFGLIQLSDLQFGEKHTFGNPSDLAERLVSDIKKMAGEYDFTPLYVVLSGDITGKAHAEEFNDGANVVERILNELNIDRRHILCVPGNHDVNWNLSELSEEAGDGQLKFLPYDNFVSRIRDSKEWFVSDHYPRIIDDQSDVALEFLLLNSCEKEDGSNHNGYVSPEKLKRTLGSNVPKAYEALKIAILHHRLDTSVTDRRSAIENARDIGSIVGCHKYNIVLTGHIHQALCHDVNNSEGHNIIFAGCGSTGADHTQREDGVQNQYCIHVIDLDRYEFESIWRAYNRHLPTEHGLGGWTKDNSFEQARKFPLPTIERSRSISPEAIVGAASSTGDGRCSKPVSDDGAEKTRTDIGMTRSVAEKTNWENLVEPALRMAIAIVNLLGGWDEKR